MNIKKYILSIYPHLVQFQRDTRYERSWNETNGVSYYNMRNAACYFLWVAPSRVIYPKIGSREEKRLLDLRRIEEEEYEFRALTTTTR